MNNTSDINLQYGRHFSVNRTDLHENVRRNKTTIPAYLMDIVLCGIVFLIVLIACIHTNYLNNDPRFQRYVLASYECDFQEEQKPCAIQNTYASEIRKNTEERERGARDLMIFGSILVFALLSFIHISVNSSLEKNHGKQPLDIRLVATLICCITVYAGVKLINKIIAQKK